MEIIIPRFVQADNTYTRTRHNYPLNLCRHVKVQPFDKYKNRKFDFDHAFRKTKIKLTNL